MGGGFRGRTNTHEVETEVEKERETNFRREARVPERSVACELRRRTAFLFASVDGDGDALHTTSRRTESADVGWRDFEPRRDHAGYEPNFTGENARHVDGLRCAAHGWLRSKSNEPKSDELTDASS